MATLGSLIISLEANTAKFEAAMTKAEYAAKKASDNIIGALKVVGVAMAGMFSVSALDAGFTRITEMESALLKMATRLNTTVETLSSFSVMARKTGMDTEAFNTALTRMERNVSTAALANENATTTIADIGESSNKAAGALRELGLKAEVVNELPLDQKLMAFAAGMTANVEPADQVRVAMDLFGRGGAGMVNILNQGPEAMQKWIDRAQELGIITTDMAKRATEAKSAAGDLSLAWNAFARDLVDAVAPAITTVLNLLTEMIAKRQQAMAIQGMVHGETSWDPNEFLTHPPEPKPAPSEAYKAALTTATREKPTSGRGGGGGAKDTGIDRMQSIIDSLQKDLSRLTEGSLAEITAWANKTINEIEKVGKKGAETETALALLAQVEAAKKKKATEDYNLFVAKESGNAYAEIEAQAKAWMEKYKGFADAEKNIAAIKDRQIWEQKAKDYEEATNRIKSYFDILASTAPLIEDQFRWKERSLGLEVQLSKVELERWLRQKNITGEMADQYKALLALANQSKKFQLEADKMEKTGGFFGGVQAWAMRRQQSAVLSQGEAGLGLMGDIEKQASSTIGKGIIATLKGEKTQLDQVGWQIGESIINRTVEYGTAKLFDLFASVIQPAVSGLITAGATTGMEILNGSEQAASALIDAGSSLLDMLGGISEGGGGIFGDIFGFATDFFFHQGGVVYAHGGWPLKSDEVPIIAQTGERVLSRRQNRDYEAGVGGGSSIIINVAHSPTYLYRATESDYKRDAKMIVKAINQEVGGRGQRLGDGRI